MRSLTLSLLLLSFTPPVLLSQQAIPSDSRREVPYRSPGKARALAVIPGWGYFYTGEYLRGYATWVNTIAGPPIGVMAIAVPCGLFVDSCPKSRRNFSKAVGVLIIAESVWAYAFSIRDAPKSAERANARHLGFSITPVLALPPSSGGLNTGVSIQW